MDAQYWIRLYGLGGLLVLLVYVEAVARGGPRAVKPRPLLEAALVLALWPGWVAFLVGLLGLGVVTEIRRALGRRRRRAGLRRPDDYKAANSE